MFQPDRSDSPPAATLSRRDALRLLGLGGAALTTSGLVGGRVFAQAAPSETASIPGYYRFKLGSYDAVIVSDGPISLPDQPLPTLWQVPPEQVRTVLRANFLPEEANFQINPLVVNTGRETVLIDTGNGTADKNTGKLLANLRAAGIDPASIDLVVVTHAHGDHILGLLASPERNPFPNARYVINRTEWDWLQSVTPTNAPERLRGLAPLLQRWAQDLRTLTKGKLELVRPGDAFLPGFELIAAPGHTPGHAAVRVVSGGQEVIHLADTTHHQAISLRHPDWPMLFDTDANQAKTTRRALLDRVTTDRTLILGYHFAWPALGHIRREGRGFEWAPVDWDWTSQQ